MRFLCLLLVLISLGRSAGAQAVDIYEAAASGTSPSAGLVLGQDGTTTWYLRGDTLLGLDFKTGQLQIQLLPENVLERFAPDTVPSSNALAIQPGGEWAWIWDGSVGSVFRLSLVNGTILDYSRNSSRTQFKHAGGLHPTSSRPLAFSGYGYYRAKDFLLAFDDSLDTWTEVDFASTASPEPRMGAVMVWGWDSTHVAVVGGNGAEPQQQPPGYTRALNDAWLMDLTTRRWTRVPVQDGFDCVVRYTERRLGYVPVNRAREEVYLHVADPCQNNRWRTGDIIVWRPIKGEIQVLGHTSASLPVRAFLGSMYSDNGNLEIVHWTPNPAADIDVWRQWRFSVPLSQPAQASRPWWPFLVAMAVAVCLAGALSFQRARMHKRTLRIQLTDEGHLATALYGSRKEHIELSAATAWLLNNLTKDQLRAGTTLTGVQMNDLFEASYPDPDSARVLKNRAIDELNHVSERCTGNKLVNRVRRGDDARKYDYEIIQDVNITR